ncbi:MAG TPA: SDR family NAD(P)-dependent oxidoreductase, partial [Thermoleophilia bacterium]|nr:SDR family NAD(P)-dependent oxidoreductase [Thermoleophilia bacterium]
MRNAGDTSPPMSPMSAPIGDLRDVMNVSGQNVVVTGGGGGIGGGIAEAFAERGANVAILDVDIDGGSAQAEALKRHGGTHVYIECDVADRSSVRKAVDEVGEAFGRIDVLVNNAGISRVKAFLEMDEDLPEWHQVMDVNLNGSVYMTHAVANLMRAAGRGGLIINISSIGGASCSG